MEHENEQTPPDVVAAPRATIWTRSGVVLLALSVVLWLPIPIVPFLDLSAADAVAVVGALVISAEVAFWSGAALAGPEAARRTRSWFRRAREAPERTED